MRPSVAGPILCLGVMDLLLKIRGNTIEPGDVEAAPREVTCEDAVAAVGWPLTEAGAATSDYVLSLQ